MGCEALRYGNNLISWHVVRKWCILDKYTFFQVISPSDVVLSSLSFDAVCTENSINFLHNARSSLGIFLLHCSVIQYCPQDIWKYVGLFDHVLNGSRQLSYCEFSCLLLFLTTGKVPTFRKKAYLYLLILTASYACWDCV